MTNSFGLLKILSIVFKVLAWVVLLLMMIGLVGNLITNKELSGPPLVQAIVNTVLSSIMAFLMLFAFGEVIRLLLAIEQQTHKE